MSTDIFPAKLALGEKFCNRVEERSLLVSNIEKLRHTVLVSPRRYGKSSLVHYVIDEIKWPFVSVDLFLAHDDRAVTKRLLPGISQAVSQLLPKKEQVLKKVKALFSKFKVQLNLAAFQIELIHESGEIDAVDYIFTALNALASLAAEERKKVIIFIDEFQDIAIADSSKTIQGAIRHVAQATDHLMFIFSGSNRHLLLELFDDKSMPLYMLCDKLYLDRIASKDYLPHIQKLAKKEWGKILEERTFAKIMTLTEIHPFYVNFLCNKVWQGEFPDADQVERCWQQCMFEETRRIRAELEKLSKNQLDILKTLAIHPAQEPTGKNFSMQSGVSPSSLHQAVNVLFEKDMLFKVTKQDEFISVFKTEQIRVLDPLIAYYIKKLTV